MNEIVVEPVEPQNDRTECRSKSNSGIEIKTDILTHRRSSTKRRNKESKRNDGTSKHTMLERCHFCMRVVLVDWIFVFLVVTKGFDLKMSFTSMKDFVETVSAGMYL